MTSPVMVTPPRPELTVDPPRRAFGSYPKPLKSDIGTPPTTSSSANGSPTPASTNFLVPPAEPQRTRSASSTSSEAIETAATKAQAWLQGWAPKGEGRGRDFLTNTLSGVAGVASTVGHGINGAVTTIGVQLAENGRERAGMGSRPSSYTYPASSTPADGMSPLTRTGSWSPPMPIYSASTPQLPLVISTPVPPVPSPASKRIVQPSNLSRLGSGTSTNMTVSTSLSSNRPSIPHPTSTTSLPPGIPRSSSPSATLVLAQPHGPSHLNPHNRSSSHSLAQFPSSQSRQPSYGARSPTVSRSSSVTAGPSLTSRSAGMPYKIGFQPAGVRNDRTAEFAEARRKCGEEREKEEGRLGRRWAKVRSRLSSSHR